MKKRLDLYGECNLKQAPVDVFTAECCMRCINPECTRSQFGTSHFDARSQNWFERLFLDVPRMDPGDPRFNDIRAQKFLLIQPAIAVNTSAWVDPRSLEAPKVEAPIIAAPTPATPVIEPPASPPVVVEVIQPEVSSEPITPPVVERGDRRVDPTINTPPKSGQMIGSKSSSAGQGWVQPTIPPPGPQMDNAKVVRTGAKIKLGGSGESGV